MSLCLPHRPSWKSVADYIDQQFEQYFRDESGLNRKNIQDNRVHCCLYFISPFGHGYISYDMSSLSQYSLNGVLSSVEINILAVSQYS